MNRLIAFLSVAIAILTSPPARGQSLSSTEAPSTTYCDHKTSLRDSLLLAIDRVDWDDSAAVRKLFDATSMDSMYVTVFGDANVKSGLKDTTGNSRASGALGVLRSTCDLDFMALLNVAATSDTIGGSFGTSLLSPAVGDGFKAGLIDLRIRNAFPVGRGINTLGLHLYGSLASAIWRLESGTERPIRDVAVVGLGASIYKQVLRQPVGGSFVSVSTDLGFAYRGIVGNLGFPADSALRRINLGTSSRHFGGIEAGFNIQFNQLRGALQYYHFFGNAVPGFSRGQIVAGFAVLGNIVAHRGTRRSDRLADAFEHQYRCKKLNSTASCTRAKSLIDQAKVGGVVRR